MGERAQEAVAGRGFPGAEPGRAVEVHVGRPVSESDGVCVNLERPRTTVIDFREREDEEREVEGEGYIRYSLLSPAILVEAVRNVNRWSNRNNGDLA